MTTRRKLWERNQKIECMGEIIQHLIELTDLHAAYKSDPKYSDFMSTLRDIKRNVFTAASQAASQQRIFRGMLELKTSFTQQDICVIQTLVVKLTQHESLFPDIIQKPDKRYEEWRLEISNKKVHRQMWNLMLVVDNIECTNVLWKEEDNTPYDEPLVLIMVAFLNSRQKVQCMKQSVQRLQSFASQCETEARYTAFLAILKDVRSEVAKTIFMRQDIHHIQILVEQLYTLVSVDCNTKTQRYLKIYAEVENLSKIVASIYKDAAELTQKYEARRVCVRMTGEWMQTDSLSDTYTSKLRNIQDYMHVRDNIGMVMGVLDRMPSILTRPIDNFNSSLSVMTLLKCIENLSGYSTSISKISHLLPPIEKFYIRQEIGASFNTHFDPKSIYIKETLLQLCPVFQNILRLMYQLDHTIFDKLQADLWSPERKRNWESCKEIVSNATEVIDRFVHTEHESSENQSLNLNLLLRQLRYLPLQ